MQISNLIICLNGKGLRDCMPLQVLGVTLLYRENRCSQIIPSNLIQPESILLIHCLWKIHKKIHGSGCVLPGFGDS